MNDAQTSTEEEIRAYIESQKLTPITNLDEISEGDVLTEISRYPEKSCDFYVVVARRFLKDGHFGGGPACWDFTGDYAWAWIPGKPGEAPSYKKAKSNRHSVYQGDLEENRYFLITELDSPLGKIANKII